MNNFNLKKIRFFLKNFKIGASLSLSEQIHFTERLSFLLKSGVSLFGSLSLIAEQTKSKKIKPLYQKLVSEISEGRMLSESLQTLFDGFSLSLIQSGEQSGFLNANLAQLSEQLKRRRQLFKKIRASLIYPAFIAFSSLGITVFLVFYIFPKILPVIKSLNVELPLATKAIIVLVSFFTNFWLVILLSIILLIFGFTAVFNNSKKFKFLIHKFILKLPLVGKLYRDFLLVNFCRNFNLLMLGNLPADAALECLKKSSSNLFLKLQIKKIHNSVVSGGSLAESLSQCRKIFPELLFQLVAVGEQTGSLPAVFGNLAEHYENEFSEKIKNLSLMIEPLFLVIAGLAVGLIAISIIAPVYEITQNLQKR